MKSTSKLNVNFELRATYKPLIQAYWDKASQFERKGLETNDVNYLVLAKHNRDLAKATLDWIVAQEAKHEND